MSGKQIFQTDNHKRWLTFKWITRSILVIFIIAAFCVGYTLLSVQYPEIPVMNANTILSKKQVEQLKKSQIYKSFKIEKDNLIKVKRDRELNRLRHPDNKARINAAFYVSWAGATHTQSLNDLRQNIKHLDMVITESFFLKNNSDTLIDYVDTAATNIIKKNKKAGLAIVSNYNSDLQKFDGNSVHTLLHNTTLQNRFIDNLITKLKKYGYHGVNIDFEELTETSDETLIAFQKNLYGKLHQQNLLVTQDISPDNDDYRVEELQKYNDYIFVMAYDQHSDMSNAGDISNQVWVEEQLDKICSKMPSEKVILALACYGYDWPKDNTGKSVTYAQAIGTASLKNSKITFDPASSNSNYTYTDDYGLLHQVYFTDAATNFNLIRKADDWATAGIAIWRLGSEDPRLWQFISKDLTFEVVSKTGVELKKFTNIGQNNLIDYNGSGDILDLVSTPKPGKAKVELDSATYSIKSQQYEVLPTKYVIRKFGEADKKIVLTFDDGPDPVYTPQILDILQKEKVPAAFFVVGIMAEQHMPLLRKEFDLGYEIGNHTFFHPDMSTIGPQRVRFELNATRRLIECVTGHSTVLFRPPFNADAEPQTTAEVLPVAQSRKENYINIGESIDPQDWQPGRTADQIFNAVVKQKDNGNILLLHDAGGNREATIEALPRIIKYFKENGYQITTIADLIGKKKSELMPAIKSDANSGFTGSGDYLFVNTLFYGNMFLNFVFTIAIILAILRTVFIAYLAIRQKRLSKKEAENLIQDPQEKVSIIIPAYNEEVTVIKTIKSLLKTTYKNVELIFVDDGSKDNTYSLVNESFKDHPKVRVFSKPNGGKASALNFGIAHATSKYLVCIDADTQLKPDAVTQLMRYFYSDDIAAVAGTVKVGNARNIITKWQSIEYITAQNMDRRAFDLLNSITVVPGAIGAFRKDVILEVGGFTTDTLAEDCDLTMRILKAGYIVKNASGAIAFTEAPETVNMLLKQRFRWSYGVMQSFWKNRKALFNKKYGYFGSVGLPNILIYQIILPLFAPLADFFMLLSLVGGIFTLLSVNSLNWSGFMSILSPHYGLGQVLLYYLIFIIVDMFFAAIAFKMEREKYKNLLYLIPQRFFWRQLMYIVLFRSLRKALKGEMENWGVLKRTGSVKEEMA